MKTYPARIDLSKYAGISDEEIKRDIEDTEREIRQYEALEKADELTARNHPNPNERKMAEFRASARPHQQAERRKFVGFLNCILAAREVAKVLA